MDSQMSNSEKDQQLRDEYFKLQDQYEDYDSRALQIKGWVGAGAIAGLGVGLGDQPSSNGLTWIWIAAIVASFWYLEAKWKMFQYGIADRIRILEAHFRNDPDVLVTNPAPFQIYGWWFKTYAKDEPIYPYEKQFRPRPKMVRLARAAFMTFVHLPYSIIIGICFVMYLRSN